MLEKNKKEALIQNLKDAGCDLKTTNRFKDLLEQGKIDDIYILLKKYRESLLNYIHKKQKEIDILDYLVLDLKNIKM